MSRKNDHPAPPAVDLRIDDRGNTGIYHNRDYYPQSEAAADWIGQQQNRPLAEDLLRMDSELRKFLDEQVGADGWQFSRLNPHRVLTWQVDTFSASRGPIVEGGCLPGRLSKLTPQMQEAVKEAFWALGYVQIIQHAIEIGNAGIAATWSFKLGSAVERIGVRSFEAAAATGLRQATRNRENNRKRSEAAEGKNKERRNEVYRAMERQVRNHERLDFKRAMSAAATACGCTVEAIKKAKPINRWTARKKTQG